MRRDDTFFCTLKMHNVVFILSMIVYEGEVGKIKKVIVYKGIVTNK